MRKNVANHENLTPQDLRLLNALQEDCRVSNAELAQRLAMSEAACWRRTRALEEAGYVESYEARLNPGRLGFGVMAFVHIRFSSHSEEALRRFYQAVENAPEVMSCHNVTGACDFILRVVARNLEDYGDFIDRVLRRIDGIVSIESNISLKQVKISTRMPIRA